MGIFCGIQNSPSLLVTHTRGPTGAYFIFPRPLPTHPGFCCCHFTQAPGRSGHIQWPLTFAVCISVLVQITGGYPEQLQLNALELSIPTSVKCSEKTYNFLIRSHWCLQSALRHYDLNKDSHAFHYVLLSQRT